MIIGYPLLYWKNQAYNELLSMIRLKKINKIETVLDELEVSKWMNYMDTLRLNLEQNTDLHTLTKPINIIKYYDPNISTSTINHILKLLSEMIDIDKYSSVYKNIIYMIDEIVEIYQTHKYYTSSIKEYSTWTNKLNKEMSNYENKRREDALREEERRIIMIREIEEKRLRRDEEIRIERLRKEQEIQRQIDEKERKRLAKFNIEHESYIVDLFEYAEELVSEKTNNSYFSDFVYSCGYCFDDCPSCGCNPLNNYKHKYDNKKHLCGCGFYYASSYYYHESYDYYNIHKINSYICKKIIELLKDPTEKLRRVDKKIRIKTYFEDIILSMNIRCCVIISLLRESVEEKFNIKIKSFILSSG